MGNIRYDGQFFTPLNRGLSVSFTTTPPAPRPLPNVCAYTPLLVVYPASGGLQRRKERFIITCLLHIYPASVSLQQDLDTYRGLSEWIRMKSSIMEPCSFPPQRLCICFLFFPEGSLPPPRGHLTNVYPLQVSLTLSLLFKHSPFTWQRFLVIAHCMYEYHTVCKSSVTIVCMRFFFFF